MYSVKIQFQAPVGFIEFACVCEIVNPLSIIHLCLRELLFHQTDVSLHRLHAGNDFNREKINLVFHAAYLDVHRTTLHSSRMGMRQLGPCWIAPPSFITARTARHETVLSAPRERASLPIPACGLVPAFPAFKLIAVFT